MKNLSLSLLCVLMILSSSLFFSISVNATEKLEINNGYLENEQEEIITKSDNKSSTQLIEIHQVEDRQLTKNSGIADTAYAGVNDASWSIYDITDYLNELVESKDVSNDDLSESDRQASIELELSGKNYDTSKLSKVDSGVTKTVNGISGILNLSVVVKNHQYKALLFENIAVPKDITKAESFVLIMPLADDDGSVLDKISIQPKYNDNVEEIPYSANHQILLQTGDTAGKCGIVVGFCLLIFVIGISIFRYSKAKLYNKKQ